MAKITGRDKRVAEWLEKIGIDPKMTRRVVIDISANSAVYIYIEQYGDSRIFEIEPPPELTTAIHLVPPQPDFKEVNKTINGLRVNGQPIIPSDGIRPIHNLKKEEEPTTKWIDEFVAKQQSAIKKWEHPDD